MLTPGKYHSKEIHEWDGIRPSLKCICKNFEVDADGFYPDLKTFTPVKATETALVIQRKQKTLSGSSSLLECNFP